MITAIVQFDLPKDIDSHKAEELSRKLPFIRAWMGLSENIFVLVKKVKVRGFTCGKQGRLRKKFMVVEFGVSEL